jgi:hypothetical protein
MLSSIFFFFLYFFAVVSDDTVAGSSELPIIGRVCRCVVFFHPESVAPFIIQSSFQRVESVATIFC